MRRLLRAVHWDEMTESEIKYHGRSLATRISHMEGVFASNRLEIDWVREMLETMSE
jgi:hypothetical protein